MTLKLLWNFWRAKLNQSWFIDFVCLFCCFTSQVNSYGHGGTVSSPNHTFSWAGLMGKRELVALLNLSSLCLVIVAWRFLAVPWGCLRFVIVIFQILIILTVFKQAANQHFVHILSLVTDNFNTWPNITHRCDVMWLNGPPHEKTCLRGFGNKTGADQPAHPHSLISAFVIRLLESIICKLATGEISIF